MSIAKLVIFSDLDGTLLDHDDYSYTASRQSLERVRSQGIPLVFCSSKTRAEQEVYRTALGIHDPFVVENGGAVFIDQEYFPFKYDYHRQFGRYNVIELGKPYEYVVDRLLQASHELELVLRRYGNMTSQQVAEITGLDEGAAFRAKQREYEETIVDRLSPDIRRELEACLSNHGLSITYGARFCGIAGANSSKGRAVDVLTDLYRRQYGKLMTVALGDSHNDQDMLAAVDLPFLVKKADDEWEKVNVPHLCVIDAIGPLGWVAAVTQLLDFAEGGFVHKLVRKEEQHEEQG